MKRKTWSILTAGALIAALLTISLTVIVIDPFQVYRLAASYMPPIDRTTQVYANAGIARNYEYDSAIVGTSVTENFHPRLMDEKLGGRFIKLCSSAGTTYSHAILLDLAFRTHDMRRIVYGLDVYSFIGDLTETPTPVPLYLYDDNFFNDAQYWLNRSVLGSFLPRCLRAWGQKQDDTIRDTMYDWGDEYQYGKEYVMYNQSFPEPESRLEADNFVDICKANLEVNLIPFIESHPETQFDFFYPPYSAAEWASMESKGILEAMLTLRGVCYDALQGYENVAIYDFAAHEEWTLDLHNYKDMLHYGPWINDAMVDAIAAGEFIVQNRTQLDAATEILRARALEIFQAGRWLYE